MKLLIWRLIALLITALSLGPSFAHMLEAYPRINIWSPELWRDATVFHGQFWLFGVLGGPLDGGAILVTAILAYLTRNDRPAFHWALAGAILFAISLTVWVSVVAPANSVMATWTPGPIPNEFYAIRNRWESGHIAIAIIKFLGVTAIVLSVLFSGHPVQRSHNGSERMH